MRVGEPFGLLDRQELIHSLIFLGALPLTQVSIVRCEGESPCCMCDSAAMKDVRFMTTKIILTRHGHVEGINPRRFRGRTDVPLTELGIAQAKITAIRIAAAWQPIAVYSSPMKRCVRTAVAIAEACNAPCESLASLNDLDYGAWQWKMHAEIAREFPEEYSAWRLMPHRFRFPKGDSLQDLVGRAADALRWVLQKTVQ
jgi:broad specificity phosphatase PhoE